MKFAFFDYSGTPVRLSLDGDGLPTGCELFDSASGEFISRDELTPEIFGGRGARLIGKEEFDSLTAKLRGAS
ncbi:hypothetical protein K3553_02595 [Leisingera aquaemixtae]|uniref:hypothetical protein n=1 Tax=Leisingera aquaemixtae TaxID=1396826 RepID=UPI0021A2C43C|nr:hypothetical protein [Leisingera aquaemixtae]UWQ25376.1 hypothetical protein K3553_02595 [Leisingera aquaemixtae]